MEGMREEQRVCGGTARDVECVNGRTEGENLVCGGTESVYGGTAWSDGKENG